MSEVKKERTMEEIQKEYGAICASTGQLQYQAFIISKDLELLNSKLRDLNIEAAGVAKKAQEASAEKKEEVVNE
jgi:hypothetical protein